VVWSFAYLAIRNLFALALLLARSDRSKELEILVLRHELTVLRRRTVRPRIDPPDRALLAALSQALPRRMWAAFSVRPETLLRWHRGLVARRWTYPHRQPGRPPLERPRRELILRLARENPHWGYQRIAGELKNLGVAASATTVRKVWRPPVFRPHPGGHASHGARSCVSRPPACSPVTSSPSRRSGCGGSMCSSSSRSRPAESSSLPAPRTPPELGDAAGAQPHDAAGRGEWPLRLLVHDRDRKFSRAFDDVVRCAGIEVIRTPVQAPNANAFAERWVRTVRNDCLDRIYILGRRHLERVLCVYRKHYNEHRPHRALQLLPPNGRNSDEASIPRAATAIRRHDLLGGLIHEYQQAA
jgi:putative transposase